MSLYHLSKISTLAKSVSKCAERGKVIALYGNIGVGKTTLAKYLISYLTGIKREEITSPTFTLLNEYPAPKFTIYHYDLYRLQQIEEVLDLGIEENFGQGYSIIEWPEIIEEILPATTLRFFMTHASQTNMRNIIIKEGN